MSSVKKYYGIYQGIVSKTNDPKKRGRIKILCPEVLGGDTESAWCDPCVPVAYDNGGDFCIPQKDEAVWVLFIGGESNKPVYIGGWWSDNKTPLGDTYSNAESVRLISFLDNSISMTKDSIVVSKGDISIEVTNSKIIVHGDLEVIGSIKANTVTTNNTTI